MRAVIAATVVAALMITSCGGDSDADAAPTTASVTTSTTEGGASPSESTPGDDGIVLEPEYQGDGPRVAVLGDSLTVQGRDDLRAALPDRALRIAAVRGEGLVSGPYSQAFDQTMMRDAAADLGATDPDVAVLALGTNDAWTPDGTLPETLDALDQVVADLGGACLVAVLVDADAPAEDFDAEVAAAINARLAEVADETVDWGAIAREDGVLGDDGIHPTEEGQRRWAEAVADAVRDCTPSG